MFHGNGHDDRHYGYWHPCLNDTEHAVELPPWKNCCGEDVVDECLCITSADADAWDSTYNTVFEYSAFWQEKVEFAESAGLWNSCYDTVYENSANWNEAYDFVNKYSNSAEIWNSAANYLNDAVEFIDRYGSQSAISTDESLEGDGTEELPLGLNRFWKNKIDTVWGVMFRDPKVITDKDTSLPMYEYDVDKKLYTANWVAAVELTPILNELKILRDENSLLHNEIVALRDHYDEQNEYVLEQAKKYTDSKLGK